MDEEEGIEDLAPQQTVGERLREAREAKKIEIEDIASTTRIPTRHLLSLEESNWAELPAPTYTLGFAKAYAGFVDLDREDIADQLKREMGGWDSPVLAQQPEYLEPGDPKKAMPKGLVIGALIALGIVALVLNWLGKADSDASNDPAAIEAEAPTVELPANSPLADETPVSERQVSLKATDRVWLRIRDGSRSLFDGEMAAGDTFVIPADASNPTLVTGRAEALEITVGDKVVAQVGPSSVRVEDISLDPQSLLDRPERTATPTPTTTPRRTAPRRTAPTPTPTPTPAETTPSVAAGGDAASTDEAPAQ